MKIKKAYLGLLILAIMFGSSLAYPLLQGLSGGGTVQLPNTNIVSYPLTLQQQYLALSKGMVVLDYRYDSSCKNCSSMKNYLEQLVSSQQFKPQTFLQEVLVNGTIIPTLNITGFKIEGRNITLDYISLKNDNITQNITFNSICEVMLQPPIDCALKKV